MIKKWVPEAAVNGMAQYDEKPELMLRMAIADIESLIGMSE
jgi:hypothetical protein